MLMLWIRNCCLAPGWYYMSYTTRSNTGVLSIILESEDMNFLSLSVQCGRKYGHYGSVVLRCRVVTFKVTERKKIDIFLSVLFMFEEFLTFIGTGFSTCSTGCIEKVLYSYSSWHMCTYGVLFDCIYRIVWEQNSKSYSSTSCEKRNFFVPTT